MKNLTNECLVVSETVQDDCEITVISKIDELRKKLNVYSSLSDLEKGKIILSGMGFTESEISSMSDAQVLEALTFKSSVVSRQYVLSDENTNTRISRQKMGELLSFCNDLTAEGEELVQATEVPKQVADPNDTTTHFADGCIQITTSASLCSEQVASRDTYWTTQITTWLNEPTPKWNDLAVIASNASYVTGSASGVYRSWITVRKQNGAYVADYGVDFNIDHEGNVTNRSQLDTNNGMYMDYSGGFGSVGMRFNLYDYPISSKHLNKGYNILKSKMIIVSAHYTLDSNIETGLVQAAYGHKTIEDDEVITYSSTVGYNNVSITIGGSARKTFHDYYGEPVAFYRNSNN